ncbi:zinc finger protein [Amycolatopsis sp. NPDC059027]|uniref:zinc finger protein n=1 Tax=unclassified Amycolatopsis TaxID=2618356 RepID=UPI00367138D2
MSALIYLNLDAVHPVIDGRWHRARLTSVPRPGEQITMLCGVTADAEFEGPREHEVHGVPKQCWDCDLVYRREHGIDVLPQHPGIPRAEPGRGARRRRSESRSR